MQIRIYSISDKYLEYLRSDPELSNVFDSRQRGNLKNAKHLGVVVQHEGFNYYIPLSSPKKSDYVRNPDGTQSIRKSVIPIIRVVSNDSRSGMPELKATLKICNMIPVPDNELEPYNIKEEPDIKFRDVVLKEYAFIRSHTKLIQNNVRVLYSQQIHRENIFQGKQTPKYLESTVNFKYAEQKCTEYIRSRTT